MNIIIGHIENKYGNNYYASNTDEGIQKQIAKYCRDEWDSVNFTDKEMPEADDEIISTYFKEENAGMQEYLNIETAEIID